MDRFERLVLDTLKAHGAEVVRQKKHVVWRFPDGRTLVHASTPSDSACAWKNNWTDLRKMLGLADEGRGAPGERREKRVRHIRATPERAQLQRLPNTIDSGLLGRLLAVVRLTKPKYQDCFPMELQLVMRTPTTVMMAKLCGMFGRDVTR